MNESKFTISKFILFVCVLTITTFVLVYLLSIFLPDKQEKEAEIIAIVGIITNVDNNRLSIDIESIYPKHEYDINKAVVLIEDSTEIISQSDVTESQGGFLSLRAPAPVSELINKNRIYVNDKVRIFTNSSNTVLKLETNILEAKADVVQVLSNNAIVR